MARPRGAGSQKTPRTFPAVYRIFRACVCVCVCFLWYTTHGISSPPLPPSSPNPACGAKFARHSCPRSCFDTFISCPRVKTSLSLETLTSFGWNPLNVFSFFFPFFFLIFLLFYFVPFLRSPLAAPFHSGPAATVDGGRHMPRKPQPLTLTSSGALGRVLTASRGERG